MPLRCTYRNVNKKIAETTEGTLQQLVSNLELLSRSLYKVTGIVKDASNVTDPCATVL